MRSRLWRGGTVARRALALPLCVAVLSACGPDPATEAAIQATGGDPERGQSVIKRYGCGSCHTISGVAGANGRVGPPLNEVGRRQYLAGMLPNTPTNMVRWIRDPTSINGATAMPDMGVTEAEARDISAYLYSIR